MASEKSNSGFVPPGYKLLNKLGSGQTSHVHLARHAVFGDVALKLPRPEIQQRPVLKRMFENEVSITVKLLSPSIVTAYDGYPTGENAFLALEYCSGGTLDQLLLEQGKLQLERAYHLILDVATGLTHTHERSVLHRDVKPANVFLTGAGKAKLGDFGTGVFMADEGEERVGTAFYMAPEVFEGRSSGVRSDIYSLGVLAYEVIAGRRPFIADTYEALMVAHHTEVPKDLRTFRPEVDQQVVRLVAKAMTRDPEKRFQQARQFLEALRGILGVDPHVTGDGTPPAPVTGRSSRAVKTETPAPKEESRRGGGGLFGWIKRGRG